MSTKRGAAQFSAKPGHYAIGLRDGGSEWHIGTDLRRECPSCTARREGSDPASPVAALDEAWATVERSLPKGSPEWEALIRAAVLAGRAHVARLAESSVTGEGQ